MKKSPSSAEAWLCERFEVERQGDLPAAPYCLLADGGEPGKHYWLRADPVHLKLEGGRLVLADSGMFSISQDEAESLADSLNAHFSGDGLVFYPLRPDRWYLRVAQAPALETTALAQAAGRSIDALLPRGSRRRDLARAPATRSRCCCTAMRSMKRARPRASWRSTASGSGAAAACAEAVPAAFNAVWSGDPFATGLARAARDCGAPAAASTRRTCCVPSAGPGVSLIVLDRLRAPAQYGDAHGWRAALQQLERDWFSPLLEALQAGAHRHAEPARARTRGRALGRGRKRRPAPLLAAGEAAGGLRLSMTSIVIRPIPSRARDMLAQQGLHPVLAQLYAARGVLDKGEVQSEFSGLIPPERLLHADRAATLLADAIAARPAPADRGRLRLRRRHRLRGRRARACARSARTSTIWCPTASNTATASRPKSSQLAAARRGSPTCWSPWTTASPASRAWRAPTSWASPC